MIVWKCYECCRSSKDPQPCVLTVNKGDPEVLRLFLSNLEKECTEKGIKMKYEPIAEIEVSL